MKRNVAIFLILTLGLPITNVLHGAHSRELQYNKPILPSFENARFVVFFEGDLNGEIAPCG